MTFDTNVIDAFNENAEQYFQRFQSDQQYHAWYHKFTSLLGSQDHILDVGCGPGITTAFILNQLPNAHIVGIDLSPNMINLSRKHVKGADFKVMNCLDISKIELSFNAVINAFVIPYLDNKMAQSLIAQSCDCIEAGGHLFLSWITHSELSHETSTSSDGKYSLTMYYHEAKDIVATLKKKGFSIIYSDEQIEPMSQKTEYCLIAQRIL